jgi:hypothetical protein
MCVHNVLFYKLCNSVLTGIVTVIDSKHGFKVRTFYNCIFYITHTMWLQIWSYILIALLCVMMPSGHIASCWHFQGTYLPTRPHGVTIHKTTIDISILLYCNTMWFLSRYQPYGLHLWGWSWRQCLPSKCWYLHAVLWPRRSTLTSSMSEPQILES